MSKRQGSERDAMVEMRRQKRVVSLAKSCLLVSLSGIALVYLVSCDQSPSNEPASFGGADVQVTESEPPGSANRDHAATMGMSFDELTEHDIGKTCVVTVELIGFGGMGAPLPPGMMIIFDDRILYRGELFKIEHDSIRIRHLFPGSTDRYKRAWIPRSSIRMIEFVKQQGR